MKIFNLSLLVLLVSIISCNSIAKKENNAINSLNNAGVDASKVINKDSLVLNGNTGIWSYKENPYSGFAVRLFSNDSVKEKTGFLNGKKHGVYNVWFENGMLKIESYYYQNTLEGSYKAWWNNGVLASESNYVNGKQQGIARKWFYNGKISKQSNLLNGREDGLQQAWLENGKLYVNYEAKNGRIFGMRRANSCYKLEDEVVIRKEKK